MSNTVEGGAEIVLENWGGEFELMKYDNFPEVCRAWNALELDTEGEPGDNDIVLEWYFGDWVAYYWEDCDTPVITGYHSIEEIVPAAYRWLNAHNKPASSHFWIKEGGVFSLLELA